jgi:hypothetical protein
VYVSDRGIKKVMAADAVLRHHKLKPMDFPARLVKKPLKRGSIGLNDI